MGKKPRVRYTLDFKLEGRRFGVFDTVTLPYSTVENENLIVQWGLLAESHEAEMWNRIILAGCVLLAILFFAMSITAFMGDNTLAMTCQRYCWVGELARRIVGESIARQLGAVVWLGLGVGFVIPVCSALRGLLSPKENRADTVTPEYGTSDALKPQRNRSRSKSQMRNGPIENLFKE